MTKIKFCGISRPCDVEAVNRLRPEFIGFVFAPKSRRYVTPEKAAGLKGLLAPGIRAVGVFVREEAGVVGKLLQDGIIDMAQLHGGEDEDYIRQLRRIADGPIIKAFCIGCEEDVTAARDSSADYVLLDSGAGTGNVFDWTLIQGVERPYFLAGGLGPHNVECAVRRLRPYAVDVSSGIETGKVKDVCKMAEFAAAVRKENRV